MFELVKAGKAAGIYVDKTAKDYAGLLHVAKKIADEKKMKKMSAQAVGNAVSKNPISILVPCHRVIGNNNNLTGYAGGIEKKIELLKLEGIDVEKYYIPDEK